MAHRAFWKGQIRLALVSIPVEVFTATNSSAAIRFRQIHEPSGKPVRYEKVVPGIGPVDTDEILKGYQMSKEEYVLLDNDEIESVRLESKKTLELVQFVKADEIDVLYYEKPYFVAPADSLANEAYVVLRDSLRQSGKVGLGQLAVRGRERLVSLKPCGRGLVLETLRYADEVNRASSYFADIEDEEPDEELLELASTLIERKSAPFDAKSFSDNYAVALRDLIDRKAKAKGRRVVSDDDSPARSGTSANVIDLMSALKASVEKKEKASAPRKTGRKASPRKAARKRA